MNWCYGCLALLCLFSAVQAEETIQLPAQEGEQPPLVIYSATDYNHMAPLLHAFQQRHPTVAIRFVDANSQQLYQRVLEEGEASPADLLLSSAMDLQLKLVNDGHARVWRSARTNALPANIHWRHELFAVTVEPVLMVFNRQLLGDHALPQSRQELLALLRRDPERFRGRIHTYDITQSGVGYLLATQDSLQGESYGRLLEAFGGLSVHLSESSNQMLAELAAGRAVLGYNLLGSYVAAALEKHPQLVAVAPRDYSLILMRLALIPRHARQPALAGELLDFMLSPAGQAALAEGGLLPLLAPNAGEPRLTVQPQGPVTPIPLTPALLPALDPLDQQGFVRTWIDSLAP
ncbi:Fe3+ ABC transporter periplasmic protein [Oceanimonas sp. GK1]|uniref:ABC transporter substrate-binding protein n=1 Tax=Oceanimonas sp. (strain GK1 / IBRC-M 10197) TaxID=511062 RepID=UPI0002495496|nr:ABC transporter substrate-binding protein [Oceanimonas sp. GK1]AEY02876.1 Fe3+ ABC transporter periplasmic protein [Oceanimonas sp. GK1]